jgi:type VI protein secretion system component VasK
MDQLLNLPTSIKALLASLVAGCVGLLLFIFRSAMWPVLVGLVVVVIIFCLYLLVLRMLRQRQAKRMSGDMAQHSTVAPRGLSDPSQRAKLDNLRQNFQRGVEKFRAAGKDIYKLPWYVVVGEPGAGKTEAIRHCNVGFPPGLQDELQGAGGTINMNWWFTNHAILLDTAGRLMFEEVAPGSTSEWREFLSLMRRSRPNCPVNGLVLVIPADSLIKDTGDGIAKKASRIAQQLSTIQGVLVMRINTGNRTSKTP